MRILIAVDSTKGGAGNIAQIMALYFKEHGYDTHLLFTMGMSNTKHDITGLNTYCLSEHYKGIIKKISGVKKIIKEINPDIIISFLHTVSPIVLASQWFTKTPIIVSERSNPYTNVKTKKYRLFRKITYRRANLVTVQFDVFKEFDKRLFKKNRIVTVPNMILSPSVTKEQRESDIVSFTTMCSLYYVKRVDLMIRLFAQVNKKMPNTRLNIYGEGIDKDKLTNLIYELGLDNVVTLCGYTTDIYQKFIENDIYLMTSEREGFPNSLSEAMAVGLPAVAIKCHDGLKEIIKNGINGYLIDEGDENAFVEKCCEIANDYNLRKKMSENAISIAKRYDIDNVMNQWIKHINSLVKQ